MTSETSPPPAAQLLAAALCTATVRCLPCRWLPRYPVPLRCGVPVPRGRLSGGESAWLIGPNDEVLPAQTEVLGQWPDGSARWMLIDVVMVVRESTPTEWKVAFSKPSISSSIEPTVECLWMNDDLSLRTGALDVTWHSMFGICKMKLANSKTPVFGFMLPQAFDVKPQIPGRSSSKNEFALECSGPIRTTVKVSAQDAPSVGLYCHLKQSVFAGSGLIHLEICLRNTNRARHIGGLWDLGDAKSIYFREVPFSVDWTELQTKVDCQLSPGDEWVRAEAEPWPEYDPKHSVDVTPDFSLHQESSGGDNWNSINHVNRTRSVPLRYRGFVARTAAGETTGLRANPSIRESDAECCLTATMPDFWQQFPKSISAHSQSDGLTFGLFPARENQSYELQAGEQKTHTVWLKLDPLVTDLAEADLSWVHDPPRLVPVLNDQSWMPGWPRLSPLDPTPVSRLDALSDEVLNGPKSVFARREEIDEYGWRNFGDFFADHETIYYKGEPPLISHFNNQYDLLGGLLLQGLRTEERRWWELAENLARHVIDIDLYHTTEDRAVFNGGLFWLTDHYKSCGTATHRCFSQHNAKPGQPYGGGPGSEHNYTTGLLAYYWLTGDAAAKDAVVQLAEWVIAMDDGRRTIFSLIDDGPTGFATATSQPDYHGPGRGAGNSINALLDAWLLTGNRKYVSSAETFLRRCIHPDDDIAARDLLNFELRWSYTVFLMAVFKYLACKAELQEFDAEYEYARQSLLHYARWMLEHERPYFDRSEQMEFPTETWGAQELRKANVFRWAAVYADEPLRSQLRAKGLEFAERAWHDLCRFETRTFIRPFTLAAIQGLWDAALRTDDRVFPQRGPTPASWGEPTTFVPQKQRVKQMLKSPRGLATAALHAIDPHRWSAFVDALRRML